MRATSSSDKGPGIDYLLQSTERTAPPGRAEGTTRLSLDSPVKQDLTPSPDRTFDNPGYRWVAPVASAKVAAPAAHSLSGSRATSPAPRTRATQDAPWQR